MNLLQAGWAALYRRWHGPLTRYNHYRLAGASGLVLALTGIWFLIDHTVVSYIFLFTLAPRWVWGLLCLGVGGSPLLGLALGRHELSLGGLLAVIALRLFLLWTVLVSTSGQSMLVPEHLGWVLVAGWAYLLNSSGAAHEP